MNPLRQAVWGHIWKPTVGKNQTSATSVNLHPLVQTLWGHIWKRTAEKKQTNAASVILHQFRQAIWGLIWKHTAAKSQINATSVAMHPFGQANLWYTCKGIFKIDGMIDLNCTNHYTWDFKGEILNNLKWCESENMKKKKHFYLNKILFGKCFFQLVHKILLILMMIMSLMVMVMLVILIMMNSCTVCN